MKKIQSILESIVDEEQSANESVGSFLKKSVLIALLTIPGILEADDIEKLPELTPAAVSKLADEDNETYGGYARAKAANILARTLFAEAANQGEEGKKAVASVIWNRAGHDPQKVVEVCFAYKQFSCWNDVHPATNPKYNPRNYKIKLPKKLATNSNVELAWEDCKEIASDLINGTYISTIGNRNSYYNPDKANPDWADDLQNVKKVGDHKFGYLPEHDPTNKNTAKASNATTHTVKSGETLGAIAKKYNTTIKKIVKLNKLKDPNKISVGQKLKIS